MHNQFCFEVQDICQQALQILSVAELKFRPMRRRGAVNTKKSYVIGRTNLKTKLITIDIFTPAKREPKKISAILRTLCHEVAHHQKPPFRQFWRRRWITRQHYPEFYNQVKENIEKLSHDKLIGEYFK